MKVGDIVRHMVHTHLGLGIYLGKNPYTPSQPNNVSIMWFQWFVTGSSGGSRGSCDKNELEVISESR